MADSDDLDPREREMILNDVIKELLSVTEPKIHFIVPASLQSIIRSLTYLIEALQSTDFGDQV